MRKFPKAVTNALLVPNGSATHGQQIAHVDVRCFAAIAPPVIITPSLRKFSPAVCPVRFAPSVFEHTLLRRLQASDVETCDEVKETGGLAGLAPNSERPAACLHSKPGCNQAAISTAVHERHPGEVNDHLGMIAGGAQGDKLVASSEVQFPADTNKTSAGLREHIEGEPDN